MSIFSKLFKLFVTVVLLPLIPMALLLAYYQNRQRNTLLENHYNLAEIVSSELPQYAAELEGRLSFVPSLLNQSKEKENLDKILQNLLQTYPDLSILVVLNAKGEEVARAMQGQETSPNIQTEDLITNNQSEPRFRARLSHADGVVPSLEFVYPLTDGYSVYGREQLIDLTDRLSQMRIGQTGQVYLLDPSGQLQIGPYQWNPGISTADLAKQLAGKSPLIKSLPSLEGALVGAVSSEPRLGMYVVVLQPKEEAFRSVYLSNLVLLLFLLAIAMLAYFGAHAFARNLGAPIAQLIQGAQEISNGNLNYRVAEDVGWGEFRQLIASFNKMTADLQDYQALQLKNQVSEMKEQIYRAVAHDLRAPLMGLQGYIYILSSGQVSEKERQNYLNRMAEAAQNLSVMLEDVLSVSRVEAGMALPQREQVALSPIVRHVIDTQQPIAQAKQLDLSAAIDENLMIYADPKLLSRIVSNLVSNAVKFTAKGFVKISAGETEREVWLCVQDSGKGMTAAEMEQIFEKFRQADNRAEGYGLGLFISRQLARAHGGDLTVTSQVGQGSTFTLHLPKEEK